MPIPLLAAVGAAAAGAARTIAVGVARATVRSISSGISKRGAGVSGRRGAQRAGARGGKQSRVNQMRDLEKTTNYDSVRREGLVDENDLDLEPIIDIKPSEALRSMFESIQAIQRSVEDGPGEELMYKVGKVLLDDVERRFITEGYGTWDPLSAVTIARKGHDTILQDSGIMKDSARIAMIGPGKVVVEVPYGGKNRDPEVPRRHQEGNPSTNLPQRKIVEMTPQLQARLDEIMFEWMDQWDLVVK